MATSRSIHVRLDGSSASALEVVAGEVLTPSEAVRVALEEAAERRRRRRSLAEEAARLMADPDYRAEVDEVRALMDDIRAPW